VGKEDGSGPAPPDQGQFLTVVRVMAVDDGPGGRPAKPALVAETVDPALPRTQFAAFEEVVGLFDPLLEAALLFQFRVGGTPRPTVGADGFPAFTGVEKHRAAGDAEALEEISARHGHDDSPIIHM
jgi:hypothetical protein